MGVLGSLGRSGPAAVRKVTAVLTGVGVGFAVGCVDVRYALVAGWISTAAVYLVWTWAVIVPARRDHSGQHHQPGSRTRVIVLSGHSQIDWPSPNMLFSESRKNAPRSRVPLLG